LLRYELVTAYGIHAKKPLSSDAFTQFGRHNSQAHNEEVNAAFYYLLGTRIPQFVINIIKEKRPFSQGDLVDRLHQFGINLRLMGFVRSIFDCPLSLLFPEPTAEATKMIQNDSPLNAWAQRDVAFNCRTALLVEMISRVTKSYLRSLLPDSPSHQ
jgi:hypothetical protein